jgi:hypothetical protein
MSNTNGDTGLVKNPAFVVWGWSYGMGWFATGSADTMPDRPASP